MAIQMVQVALLLPQRTPAPAALSRKHTCIPDILKGQDVIAIRMDAPGGYYAYNYFRNDPNFLNPASAINPVQPRLQQPPLEQPRLTPGYTGIPTFSISDQSWQIPRSP